MLDAAFRPDSDQIAVASADSLIRIYNVETMQLVRTIASHADWVSDIAWSDDGSRLVSGSRDKSAKVFDALSGDMVASYLGHGAAYGACQSWPTGNRSYQPAATKNFIAGRSRTPNQLPSSPLAEMRSSRFAATMLCLCPAPTSGCDAFS